MVRRAKRSMALAALCATGIFSRTLEAAETTASQVAIIVNTASSDSLAIRDQYLQIHGNDVKVISVSVTTSEVITSAQYADLRTQVQQQLINQNLLASVQYLVTTKGVPLKIQGANEFNFNTSTYASVDSELSLVGKDLIQTANNQPTLSSTASAIYNPYRKITSNNLGGGEPYPTTYTARQTFADYRASLAPNDGNNLFYLTSRLDAFTLSDVSNMLTKAQHPAYATAQTAVIDDDVKNYDQMQALSGFHLGAKEELEARGMNVLYDNTTGFITTASGEVMFYVGHGKNGGHPANYVEGQLNFTYADGAVFSSYESYNGNSMVDGANRDNQALIGQFIKEGGTAAAGNAWEPFTLGIHHEEVWMPALLDGYNFMDAMWISQELVSWNGYIIGDPLMHVVPEPSSGALLIGVTAIGLLRRRSIGKRR